MTDQARPGLAERTPVLEWIAAALGLVATLAMIGYLLWEGFSDREDTPNLSVQAEAAQRIDDGFLVTIHVRNTHAATAAAVEVRGRLMQGDEAVEERAATFAYVAGRGEAQGGLVFQNDPAAYRLETRVEGYEDP